MIGHSSREKMLGEGEGGEGRGGEGRGEEEGEGKGREGGEGSHIRSAIYVQYSH